MQSKIKLTRWVLTLLTLALVGSVVMCSCGSAFINSTTATTTTTMVESATLTTESQTQTTESTTEETTTSTTESTTTSTTEESTTTVADSSSSKASNRVQELFTVKPIADILTTLTLPTVTTQLATKEDGSVDFACFDNCAFIGNSRLLAAENYGLVKHVYAKVGLTVSTVFTEKLEGSSVAVIDELKGKKYDKVFLMFGDNECGWSSMSSFTKQYAKVIAAVKERIPGADIYILSILPVSKTKSDKNEFNVNRDSISSTNELLKKLANEQGVKYIDAHSSIADKSDYLPEDASPDGCHLGKKYTKIWLEYTARHM